MIDLEAIKTMTEEELEQLLEAVKDQLEGRGCGDKDKREGEGMDEQPMAETPVEAAEEAADAAAMALEAADEQLENLNEALEAIGERKKAIHAEKRAAAETKAQERKAAAMSGKEVRSFSAEKENKTMNNEVLYRSAWLKTLMGKELNTEERDAMTGATTSAGYAIPTTTANRIIENMVQVAPMLKEVELMHIPGNVTICVEDTVNAAAIHSEGAAVTPASDTIARIQLGGYELMKALRISAKLATMTIDAFEDWIVSNLSRKLAELMENYVVNGTGSSQPKGIDYAETWTDDTNAIDLANDGPTIAEILELIGLQNPAYLPGSKFLMNPQDFWKKIYGLRDDKNPQVVTGENGNFRLFGFPIVFSSKVNAGDYFFGDFFEGVKANMAADVAVEADKSSGFLANATDYRGTCIFDCTTVPGRIVKAANTL